MTNILIKLSILVLLLTMTISCCKDSNEGMECVENINEDCFCTQQYDPVCGCNGKTYGNSCEANCSGITNYTEGACE